MAISLLSGSAKADPDFLKDQAVGFQVVFLHQVLAWPHFSVSDAKCENKLLFK